MQLHQWIRQGVPASWFRRHRRDRDATLPLSGSSMAVIWRAAAWRGWVPRPRIAAPRGRFARREVRGMQRAAARTSRCLAGSTGTDGARRAIPAALRGTSARLVPLLEQQREVLGPDPVVRRPRRDPRSAFDRARAKGVPDHVERVDLWSRRGAVGGVHTWADRPRRAKIELRARGPSGRARAPAALPRPPVEDREVLARSRSSAIATPRRHGAGALSQPGQLFFLAHPSRYIPETVVPAGCAGGIRRRIGASMLAAIGSRAWSPSYFPAY